MYIQCCITADKSSAGVLSVCGRPSHVGHRGTEQDRRSTESKLNAISCSYWEIVGTMNESDWFSPQIRG